ncbi:MAG: hypothetical protein V1685_02015 [Parcubacteria group bacterium]
MLKRWHIFLLVGILFSTGCILYYTIGSTRATDERVRSADEPRVLDSKFYFETQFARSVEFADANDAVFPEGNIRAGIIPHDVTQGQIIAHFFSEL